MSWKLGRVYRRISAVGMVGIVMLVLAGGCFGENDIRLVIIAVLYVL